MSIGQEDGNRSKLNKAEFVGAKILTFSVKKRKIRFIREELIKHV